VPRFRFITRSPDTDYVSVYQIHYMEAALARLGVGSHTTRDSLLSELLSDGLTKLGLLRHIARLDETIYIVPLMGLKEYYLFPHVYFARIATYSFDVWPGEYDAWVRFFRKHRPVTAFISAKASTAYMQAHVPEVRFTWVPEAIDPGAYRADKPLRSRSIDVLELGRRLDTYHEAVTSGLAERGRSHLYERIKGRKVFAGRGDLIAGLGDTRLLVCFPASMTDPEAGVETLTLRYLEACASGCVPVGRAPAELIELFGYNPVVELDLERPLAHTLEILERVEGYQDLVRRNHVRMLQVATWDTRVAEMMATLRAWVG
jgi:hypothetical protein